jgi:hypothetical protein
LKTCEIDGLLIRVTIHKTGTITVIVACSWSPVAIDISGIIRLSNALTRVEERLSKLVYDIGYKPVDVAIELGLSEKQATRYYTEYLKLKGLFEYILSIKN